ncbi:MAG: B12-binding domain-containing radical SAM protein, partial [Candidatus Portnoybacteria bacterium]|nr:B12-binding domain-containing radical SAM protein [Candidatus Portnoybacteria bacterium]
NWQKILEEELPQVSYVGFSVMTTQIPSALQIAWQIRHFFPWIKLIWGGSHVTFFPQETLENNLADFVVLNEGEETLWELIQESENQAPDFSKIRGLGYKKYGEMFVNQSRELLDMEEIPLPNWDLMPEEVLQRLELVPTHTSRGCPHRCAFCINAITKNRWRMREAKKVLEDLQVIKSKQIFFGKNLRFWDENFFVDLKRVEKIIDGMIKENLAIPWETTIRADYFSRPEITDEFLSKLKESGCYLLSFGAESGSLKILKKIDKDITRGQILNSARRCLKHDIIPQYSFMVGLPGETREDINQTISLIDDLVALDSRIQILGPQAFRPYPGSTLYQECLEAGWNAPKGLKAWAQAVENELSYLTPYQFPWVFDPSLADSLEAYARFGSQSFKSALGSTVQANRILKMLFIFVCKLRWKFRFFKWPIEYKLAKKFIASQ